MARKRKSSEQTETEERTGNRMATMENLTVEQIQELLASSRQRGGYDDALKQFVESGEAGVRVPLDSGQFSGKKASSLKAGFEGARKREGAPEAAANVRVIVQEENVYLIRTDLQ